MAASYEVSYHFAFDVVVELAVRFAGVTDAEVVAPTAKVGAYFSYHLPHGFAVVAGGG